MGRVEHGDSHYFSDLAALVSHELNNYLNGISLQVVLLEQTLGEASQKELAIVRNLVKGAAALVHRLQQSNRPNGSTPETIDLNELVQRVADDLGRSNRLVLEMARDLAPVRVVPAQLERLIRMLVRRAIAVAPSEKGKTTIRTEHRVGKCVLRVEDEGPSIPQDALAGIFEPSKATEQDDMALPICQLLARRLRGTIRAENRQGAGICITVELTSS